MRRFLSILLVFLSICCYAQYDQLTNIPTVYIETLGGQSINSKTEYIYANMIYVAGADTIRYDSMQIRGRGNSTWGLAKKPYRIKFKESTKFLGKGYAKNKSWTLLANHGDKSLLRNAVTSRMGEFLGMPFNPAAHFVDLVLNGTYLGNYQVSDQVNVDNKRVEIFEQDYIASDTSNITGGYLLEIDGFATSEPVYFRTNRNLLVTVKSPDEDCINKAQTDYIRNYLNSFESLLFGINFADSVSGYRPMLDSATVIPWYIATELSANVDGFWSTYIYKDKDNPKIYFGPLWDYDIAYNNCNRAGDVTYASMIDKGFGGDLTKVWAKQLIKDPWFNKAVNDAWKRKMDEGIESHLCHYIDSMAQLIYESQERNYSRYSIQSRVYNEIYLYSTYSEYISQLKEFIEEHAAFLTTLFSSRAGDTGGGGGDGGNGGEGETELKPFELNASYYYRIYNKGTNMVLDVDDDGNGGKKVVLRSPVYERSTQQWKIEKAENAYRLLNRVDGAALNDPSQGVVDTQLDVVAADVADSRQLWKFVVVNENDNYNIINAYTDFVINNSGGNNIEGNAVISYNNDDRNSVSLNRQWSIVPDELIPDYIPDEVKEMLNATIADAESFLSSLSDWEIGDAPFHYNKSNIDALRSKVEEARAFESTVSDDYILQNVNLASCLAEARKVNEPSASCEYVMRHRDSGNVLNLTTSRSSIQQYDEDSSDQRFVFEQSEEEGKFQLKSANGLYLSLGTADSWNMFGYESIADVGRAALSVEPMEGYYRISTKFGLLGTTFLDVDSKVYGDKQERNIGISAYCDWIIEECGVLPDDMLEQKSAELQALIEEARRMLNAVPVSWIGDAPMQTSPENVIVLDNVISDVVGGEYTTVEEYDGAISLLNEAMDNLSRLNVPHEGQLYNLLHASGLNLSYMNGLTLEEVIDGDEGQNFVLIPVDGEKNSYNIYSGGYYLTVADISDNMFMLSETPCGDNGRFVVEQAGDSSFTISSMVGLVGVRESGVGEPVVPSVVDNGDNALWTLVEAKEKLETGVPGYEQNVDYALRYDKVRQVIVFVSNDIQELADVDVSVYTVGGRMLYRFKAANEQSLTELPSGTYIIKWHWAGHDHNIKFRKE